jgi:group I intron endonuclease
MTSGIYQVLNLVNGKRYVGSAANFVKRWAEHRRQLREGIHHSRVLQRAWVKYGPAAFIFKPLLICAPKDLEMYEQRALDGYQPEYNICKIAGSSLGTKRSPEQRERVAAALRGKKRGPHSPEHRAKIGAARRGKKRAPFSAAWCSKIAANSQRKRRPLTAAHKERLRQTTLAYYARSAL